MVDSEEGWSLVRPTTGAPKWAGANASTASYLGTNFQLKYSYDAETNYVCGEFYWRVQRGQKTFNRDFASGKRLLSQEQSGTEVVWSSGDQISSDAVAKAFGLEGKKDLLARDDVAPFSASPSMGIRGIIVLVLILPFGFGGALRIVALPLLAALCSLASLGWQWAEFEPFWDVDRREDFERLLQFYPELASLGHANN